ncbi:type II toxin-antitoxin system HipA family toxin [Ferrimonas pelagia]|uniref:Type II toxin-antitoxin system HipA family toxin n=1 Tax=Ferrimonas pelagia TaxID=1177826 RepID=A0ABP9ETF8_9GAMM
MQKRQEQVQGIALHLHGIRVGVVARFAGNKNILSFDPEYAASTSPDRPIVTLQQLADSGYLQRPQIRTNRLPALLSNLLPEGALRTYHALRLKIAEDDEFILMLSLGRNLPGALIAEPIPAGEIPSWALVAREQAEAIQIAPPEEVGDQALAGVQMKFSAIKGDGRFNVSQESGDDNWIVKTPSTNHPFVPANEYTAMRLAESVGVRIPDIDLAPLSAVGELPNIQLPQEQHAYLIHRFDRHGTQRIHTEDFAQITEQYAREKYEKVNYQQMLLIMRSLMDADAFREDMEEFVRRLVVNILVGNGDAHLKNWTLIYSNGTRPRLSPAYDIVSTVVYIQNEQDFALKLMGTKRWYDVSLVQFKALAKELGIRPTLMQKIVKDTVAKAREIWPTLLAELPMDSKQKALLVEHMNRLHEDFRLNLSA